MKFTLHLALCLSILLLPLCVQSKNTAGAFSVNRKFFADPEKTDSSSTEEKKDEQVEPSNANTPAPAPSVDDKTDSDPTQEKKDDQVNPPAPSVDDKTDSSSTEEKKNDQVDQSNANTPAPAPSVDDKTEEKKDDQVDPTNTQPPAPSVDDKTEEKKDDQVDPINTQPPAPSVDDKTEEKKDDQVDPINTQPPAPSVDDKTEEKKDDQVDPINTQPPAPVDDGKTPAPLDDGDTPVPDKNTTDTSVVQPDGDKSYHLTFQQKLKFLMSPKKPWIYLISGLVGFILIAFIIFGFSRFFVDSEEQEEYNMSANVEKGRDNSKIQTLQLDFYKQTTEVQIVN